MRRGRWGIWCKVDRGVTGLREGWLQDSQKWIVRYKTREEAARDADKLQRERMENPHRTAVFEYTAREIKGETWA